MRFGGSLGWPLLRQRVFGRGSLAMQAPNSCGLREAAGSSRLDWPDCINVKPNSRQWFGTNPRCKRPMISWTSRRMLPHGRAKGRHSNFGRHCSEIPKRSQMGNAWQRCTKQSKNARNTLWLSQLAFNLPRNAALQGSFKRHFLASSLRPM